MIGRQPSAVSLQRRRLAATTVILSAAVGCARVQPPPGGPRDEAAPVVLAIAPEPMSTIAPTDEPVVIEFDERISERNVEDAVYVSPATGSVDVRHGRRDLEISLAGGWQPGRVYRVVVQPALRDLFDNELERPIEVVFSTGAEFSQAAVAGVVYERVTGARSPDVRVEAHPVDGGAYHLAIADTGGIFRMPYLPPGSYLLRAYADQNRDRRRDGFEVADSITIDVGATDTVLRPLALLRPDSTPANPTRVQVVDSVTLRVQFDDYMDVSEPQRLVNVTVRSLPDSAVVALAGVYYPHALTAERERQDSIARDSVAALTPADSAAPATPARGPADTVQAGDRRTTSRSDTAAADTIPPDPLTLRVREANLLPDPDAPLPTRELLVVLEQPLVPEAEYILEVSGVLNIVRLGGGAGTSRFRAPAAPPPPATEPGADPAAPPAGDADAEAAEPDADDGAAEPDAEDGAP